MVLRTSQPRKTPTNQNMILYLSTNHNAIIIYFTPWVTVRSCRGRLGWIVCCVDRERGSKASQKLHQVAGECKKKKGTRSFGPLVQMARDRLDCASKWHAIVWTADYDILYSLVYILIVLPLLPLLPLLFVLLLFFAVALMLF